MDKHAMRIPFANSQYESDEDEDDDRSCDFDFHPYHSLQPSSSSPLMKSGLMSQIDFAKSIHGKSSTLYDDVLSSEIERKMKELSDNLLHGIEGIITRLSQLESRTQHIEDGVDDLKYSTGYNHGKTEGKLRNLENTLMEVKDGIHFLREKHEIAETKLQLDKLAAASSKTSTSSQSKDRNYPAQIDQVRQAPPYAQQQPHPPLPPPVTFPPTPPSAYQNFPQVDSTVPAQPPAPFHSLELQSPKIPAQHYHYPHPPHHQNYPPSPQHFQPVSQSSFSPAVTAQNFPPHPKETTPYFPTYNHPPSVRPQSFPYPPGSHDSHPFFRNPKSDEYSSSMEPWNLSQIPSPTGFGTNYAKLPEAQILPRAIPTARNVNDTDETRNSVVVPIDDDVVEKVTSMGFRRDLVRATARKLAENGQSVDLNVVLDKLMNSKGV